MSTASNWIGVQTGVLWFDSRIPHKPLVSNTSEADIWLSTLWPPDGCRTDGRLSTTLAAKGCVLSTQQERMVDKQGESMVASYRYLGVSNPGIQMLGSNECDVSYQYGTRASFQYIRRFPALYILRSKKNLRQLESCQPSSQYEWSMDGWMCW